MDDIYNKPAEYWHKRCILQENYTDAVITVIGQALPHIQQSISNLDDSWNEELAKIDVEFK